jgi:hypothetical protein
MPRSIEREGGFVVSPNIAFLSNELCLLLGSPSQLVICISDKVQWYNVDSGSPSFRGLTGCFSESDPCKNYYPRH